MWGVGTVPFSCILQAYTSLKCAIAKMCPLAKKRKACHSFMPKAESHTIFASMMHKPMAGMLLRHPLSLLLLGSKAEVVQLCQSMARTRVSHNMHTGGETEPDLAHSVFLMYL